MGTYELDFSKSKQLEKLMSQVPDIAEKLVNKTLKEKGTKEMIQSIVGVMPVSNKQKQHAKFSNPLRYTMKNLGFVVTTKGGTANRPGSFGYLVFPDQGRGPHNKIKQNFFEKGGDKASDVIMEQVIEALIEAHEELGGR